MYVLTNYYITINFYLTKYKYDEQILQLICCYYKSQLFLKFGGT